MPAEPARAISLAEGVPTPPGRRPNVIVVGAQWGDEGKGKVVDALAARAGLVVRFQGGSNAGHTLVAGGRRLVLHLLPSGVLHRGVRCLVASGVVVDPWVLFQEIDALAALGRRISPGELSLSAGAHVILPYHRELDALREERSGAAAIGTTRRGIGPAYEDKVARRGVRLADFVDEAALRGRLEVALAERNPLIERLGGVPCDPAELVRSTRSLARRLQPYLTDGAALVHRHLQAGTGVLFEGAQGTLLDVDHGSYPYVTSSSTVAGAACAGAGVGPGVFDHVVGVAKAYATRVGAGPFPTEISGEAGESLRQAGREYGATTGRPRRCGWLDTALLRHAARVNGLTYLVLTKLDVLSGRGELRLCTGYRGRRGGVLDASALAGARPEWETLPGWREDITGCRRYEELPAACRAYVERVEQLAGVPIGAVSVGPERAATIDRAWAAGP